jgi:ribosomal protein S18 acetylase RimI-like enzyme
MNNSDDYTIKSIDFSDIDAIKPLWEELNASHARLSTHFGGHFEAMTFEKRKTEFASKGRRGELRIDVCIHFASGEIVGYCVSNLIEGVGEIDSLFVKETHRGRAAGSLLMEAAMSWMRDKAAREITLTVAVGNERALGFYRKFGLYPRLIQLTNKS